MLKSFKDQGYFVFRVVSGLMFAFHGLQKVFGLLAEQQPPVGSQMWIGGVIELVCGFAIALGVLTRLAAFVASGTMAVAYAQFHWKFRFDANFLPGVNEGELALLYSVAFLYISCNGGGRYRLDSREAR